MSSDGEKESIGFDELIRKDLDHMQKYCCRMQSEMKKIFILSAIILGVAALIIGVGLALLIRTATITRSTIIMGVGVLVAIMGCVFFHYYNRLTTKMAESLQKLFLTHNVHLALRTAEEVPAEELGKNARTATKNSVVRELLQDINKLLATGPADRSSSR